MKTHLRQSKNNLSPACTPYGTERGVFGSDPKHFNGSLDKCKRCEGIFEKRREAQRKA